MPALPDVDKVLKVALIWSDGINTDIVTRFYIRYSGSAPGASDLATMAGSLYSEAASALATNTAVPMNLGRCHIIDLSSPTGAEGDHLDSTPGSAGGAPLPSDVAVVVSYEIARRYRGGHSRGYWPILTADELDNPQFWKSATIAAMQSGFEAMFALFLLAGWGGAGTLEHVNVSYFQGFTVVTDPTTGRARNVPSVRALPVVDPVTSYVTRLRIGTQRRRLQY
jgi:hypothetical protein